MTDRAIASSNQWKEKTGATVRAGRVIDHASYAGFLTFADAGTVGGMMVDDSVHAGFVTPDDTATTANATVLIVGGSFATPVES